MAARPILHPTNRERLVKFCGMLGSDHDGERANAARMADKLVRDAGLTWQHVIGAALPAAPQPQPRAQQQPPPRPAYQSSHIEMARQILMHRRNWLTGWEVEFLESLTTRRSLSDKQAARLRDIWVKIKGHEDNAA